ncbi:hypothetical protein HQ487_00565 [Candidatus Uhrbacteria bacterium]|nr:hypothetical protein [Candidatus Uhrbacteria bacterium]
MPTFLHLLSNDETPRINETQHYAVILGASPSKGARSPLLWNSAFKALNIQARMHPFDVDAHNLGKIVESLKTDSSFIGGAVTTPHKEAILPFLDSVEEPARRIGAVNALYRKGTDLIGTNTDGAGSLISLERHAGSTNGKRVLLLGLGGAGKAVGAYLAQAIGPEGKLTVSNRTFDSAVAFQSIHQDACPIDVIPWPVDAQAIKDADIIVHTTSVGFEANGSQDSSPLQESAINAISPSNFVFDIVYQPEQSRLLTQAIQQGAQTLNGREMNLEQAVIAFERALGGIGLSINRERVVTVMKSV